MVIGNSKEKRHRKRNYILFATIKEMVPRLGYCAFEQQQRA